MIEFLSYDQVLALVTLITSPMYILVGWVMRKINSIGCDVTALKTANNIYHKGLDKIE